jgi:XTP/dITP diphosphohydrolase
VEGSRLELSVVTENKAKGVEALSILASLGVKARLVLMGKQEIQSESLEEIALRKPLLVDDSGLFIEALNGFPGPYSSYVYKKIGVRGILKLMSGEVNRRACFKTAVATIIPPLEKVYTGETCGEITLEPRGEHGFGFDPIFIPENSKRTYAEMTLEEKNRISHRYKAYKKMVEDLKTKYKTI